MESQCMRRLLLANLLQGQGEGGGLRKSNLGRAKNALQDLAEAGACLWI